MHLGFTVQAADISIHALREEGDDRAQLPLYHPQISIHALREEGDIRAAWAFSGGKISIHALREEGDSGLFMEAVRIIKISIHALREEGDGFSQASTCRSKSFLSTPSARRATQVRRDQWRVQVYFYPRPPRGGRLFEVILMEAGHGISIHALREEGDPPGAPAAAWRAYFYPRPPRGGRRGRVRHRPQGVAISIHALREEGDGRQHVHSDVLSISIHALREEGDSVGPSTSPSATYFYPRPPRGGRLEMGCGKTLTANFYPRPPRGGRPPRNRCRRRVNRISIHALREEGDLVLLGEQRVFTSISIHALREEGDHPPRRSSRCKPISIHALREEGDGSCPAGCRLSVWISIHALREEGDAGSLRDHGNGFLFLSTPSARRATLFARHLSAGQHISIHALREEGDTAGLKSCSTMWKFLSTPSARRATRARARGYKSGVFLSTPSARRATTARRRSSTDWRLFLSTPSARRATTRLLRH